MASTTYHPSRFTLLCIIQQAPRGAFAPSDQQACFSDLHMGHRSADSQNTAAGRPMQTPVQQLAGGEPLPAPGTHHMSPRH